MAEDIKTTGIPQKKLRQKINKVREIIKDHDVVKDMFEDHGVDISEIDLIPMCFAEIDVSARTDHGIIYFNISLLDSEDGFDDDDHYMVHEITHFLQQTTGSKPTKGAEDGEYLENEFEIEGFQNQVEYMADVADENTAEEYVEQVLDHHEYDGAKAEDKKDELMATIANRTIKFVKLAEGEFDNLQPDDELTLYHGTSSTNVNMLWGVDATQEKKRNFSPGRHSGLFVTPREDTTGPFAGSHGLVIEFKTPAKYLYGTDWGGNTYNSGSKFKDINPNDIWRDKYPNSFAPYLSESLSRQHEPQALFKGMLSPDMITRVKSNSDGNWYTLDEFYESRNFERLPFDPTKIINLDDFYRIIEEMHGYDREKSERVFSRFTDDIDRLQKYVERFDWTPSVARDIAEQIINSGV